MTISIADLISRIELDSTVLFLGAGASVPSGAPLATQLTSELCIELKQQHIPGISLGEMTQILELRVGRPKLASAVARLLSDLEPDTSHDCLPSIPWRQIYTTNYDQIVEKAYNKQNKKLEVVRSNFDSPSGYTSATTLYKIHGCITQDEGFGHKTRMVLTTDDYDSAFKFRESIFRQLATALTTCDAIFVGYSLSDPDIQMVLKQAIAENRASGGSGRIYGLFFELTDDLSSVWINRGLSGVARGDLPSLMTHLARISSPAPKLPVLVSGLDISPALLPSVIRVAEKTGKSNANRIYSGYPATYADIRDGLTFSRDRENRVINNAVTACVIVGVAGTGKTTLARRALVDLSRNQKNVCLELRTDSAPEVSLWLDLEKEARSKEMNVFLFVDNISAHIRWANDLLRQLPQESALKILGAAEQSQWSGRQKNRRFYDNAYCTEIELSRLSNAEVGKLVDLVVQNGQLRQLASLSNGRIDRNALERKLKNKSKNDFFVCLKVLFSSETLDFILLSEMNALDDNAKAIYKLVCGLHAAGGPVSRQLVVRLAEVSASSIFQLMTTLDGLIDETSTERGAVFMWCARHIVVARALSKFKYSTDAEKFELIRKVIEEINPNLYSEARFLREICNSDEGVKGISDESLRISLYQRVIELWPAERVARHRLIGELLRIKNVGQAEMEFDAAKLSIGIDPPLARYGIRLQVARSKADGLDFEDRKAILTGAKNACENAIRQFPDAKHIVFVSGEIAAEWHDLIGERSLYRWAHNLHDAAYERLLDPEIEDRSTALLRECDDA